VNKERNKGKKKTELERGVNIILLRGREDTK
jgi:hypothetical protein